MFLRAVNFVSVSQRAKRSYSNPFSSGSRRDSVSALQGMIMISLKEYRSLKALSDIMHLNVMPPPAQKTVVGSSMKEDGDCVSCPVATACLVTTDQGPHHV